MTNRNIKETVATVTILLLACMAAADKTHGEPDAAVMKFCAATNYKETCMKSVAKANSAEPKDLIKAAINTLIKEIQTVINNAAHYKGEGSDEMTQGALMVCDQTLNTAISDLRSSFDKVDKIEVGTLKNNIADLKTWLSATSTNSETCVDAFEETTGDTGKKVEEMLKTPNEMISNSLAMINELEKILSSSDLGATGN